MRTNTNVQLEILTGGLKYLGNRFFTNLCLAPQLTLDLETVYYGK